MTLRAVIPIDRSTGLRANVVQVGVDSRRAAGMAPGIGFGGEEPGD